MHNNITDLRPPAFCILQTTFALSLSANFIIETIPSKPAPQFLHSRPQLINTPPQKIHKIFDCFRVVFLRFLIVLSVNLFLLPLILGGKGNAEVPPN